MKMKYHNLKIHCIDEDTFKRSFDSIEEFIKSQKLKQREKKLKRILKNK